MDQSLHPDAAAIDRIGTAAIMEHFEITRQAVFYWRRSGVPKNCRKALAKLGEDAGHPMPEMAMMRDRVSL